jgi:hypothetical protein
LGCSLVSHGREVSQREHPVGEVGPAGALALG